jgi:hypothetical protein
MPLPKLNDEQVAWIVEEVAAYIHEQRHFFYPRAVFLSPNLKAVLQPFFPASTLDSTRVAALAIERVPNPYFRTCWRWVSHMSLFLTFPKWLLLHSWIRLFLMDN